ncbi:uncharacterized protein FTJAE_13736 [Fusarium tjaetaba]|uniref:Uncharacterized protein n=1 Tax=Fusarium tjaetaba TaxID=1567544 RepID=A0A8H5QHB5_9HYPO|nr:uncharacterized protein FTJAE_13736 [Fusarium tjaetaba]KAF5614512.1 hypothetical protein FTJAE_13736 [Fusarium tjaetaba]
MSKSSYTCNSTCKDFPKEVPSYGDIGGIGVTLAFVITAWIVVGVLVGYYLKVFDPKLDPFRKEGTQKLTKYPNSIDYSVHEMLQSIPWLKHDSRSISTGSSRLGTVLNSCVLTFADIQIFTSLAILIGAYASSAIKFIVLLVWGLAIRIAKTFKGFEGGLRKTAALLEQRGNRHRRAYSGSTGRDWDHAFAHASWPRRVWSYFSVPILIGFYSVLSIQLDLFTSLLAEVYWLFFTIIWITARLIKLRIPGNQDDSKWTFGQILPIILLVAPLVLATEAFYTTSASKEPTNNHPESPVLNPDDIRDLSHIHSPAYRGVFFLAVLSYIEIAVYFVPDQPLTQGIAIPLIVILLSAFILQPVLQLSWVVCNLWLDNLAWGMPLKRTIRDVVLSDASTAPYFLSGSLG